MKLNKKIIIIYIAFMATICLVFFGKSFKVDREHFEQLLTIIKKSSLYMKIMDNKDMEKKHEEGNVAEKSSDEPIKETIENISKKFINSCFARNESNVVSLLAKETDYIRSPDGSSFIRYTGDGLLVEGYMDTDKNLADYRQRWCYIEGDKALAGVEITLKGQDVPVIWYLYYKKENGQWKLYMLENDYNPTKPAL
ncbi:hypothetical protein [Lutispora thermophila]|uniref:Uncharacterized protein n=1 Tax=Lutispora thermophila DSM 19022 TaxID=1122184 RepID=A0A1M6GDF0_9FIRM|nr:hypothetical protein [Lutispora thermophila]SHJ07963.1 hypothetical protein SAMN02745176_02324 [Lutispora thermophila DSM 19022]